MVTFRATSNNGLTARPLSGDAINDIDKLLRNTKAFRSHYQPGSYPLEDEGETTTAITSIALIRGDYFKEPVFMPSWHTGLIGTVVTAYNYHHSLQLRPDDIWLSILSQFSAYVNGRAEQLRNTFVDHEGKKRLVVHGVGNIYTADFASLTRAFLDAIAKNIKDPSLREWFLPGFSTTTSKDEVCATAAAMCSLQAYFSYECCLCCGIPEVTLLGTVEDWQLLREKIDRLLEFDIPEEQAMQKWVSLLRVVADNLVTSAKSNCSGEHGSQKNLKFWDTIVSHSGGGSGPSYLSGWITVFSFFDAKGKVLDPSRKTQSWPRIETGDIVDSTISCPVVVDDNGTEHKCRLFVGQMSFEKEEIGKAEKPCTVAAGNVHVLKPRTDWALAVAVEKRST